MKEVTRGTAAERLVEHSSAVADDLRQLGRLTGEAAKEKIGQARERAGEAYEASVEKLGEGRTYLEDCVREKPLRSIAIAAGVGMLLGLVLARRR